MDADLLSWYANYFTRFIEAVASDEWPENNETAAGALNGKCFSARNTWRFARCDGGEFAFAQIIIDAAPANGVAGETGQPDDEGHGVPQWDQRHFFPNARLLHSPDADEPGHDEAQE